jgi:hypothetical protein
MKKILVWFLVITLVTSITWLLVGPNAGPGYPTPAVTAVLETVSASSKAMIVEKLTVSGMLRTKARSLETLQIRIDRSLGRPVFDNLESYKIFQGGSLVHVTLYQSTSETGRIEIAPEPGATGLAADLKAAFLKAFPDLSCEIVAP